MISLRNITLKYGKDPNITVGLNNVSVDLPDAGLVAILGKEGSGKTSLMNVLGAITKPQEGTLFVDGKDMSSVKEIELDSYRCTYVSNILAGEKLIAYQTAAQNIAVPLKLAGYDDPYVSKRLEDIIQRAELKDIAKVPASELGGGLKQAVNIARALGSDYKMLLADEPFGDLNPEDRSLAMKMLKEASKEDLVVLATSDVELAEQYADRIIAIADGAIVSDIVFNDGALAKPQAPADDAAATGVIAAAAPAGAAAEAATDTAAPAADPSQTAELGVIEDNKQVTPANPEAHAPKKPGKPYLRLDHAIGMAAAQLTTKKGRTFVNSLVGAIAVMALGLILMLNQGMDAVYANVEGDLMDRAPVTLKSSTLNTEAFTSSGQETFAKTVDENVVKSLQNGQFATDNQVAASVKPVVTNIKITKTNDLAAFKAYMDSHSNEIYPLTTAVEYTYSKVTPQAYRLIDNGTKALKMNCSLADIGTFTQLTSAITSSLTSTTWYQMPDNQRIREANYTLEAGSWPTQANEVALVINNNRTISDFTLYTLGMMDITEMNEIIAEVERGGTPANANKVFSYNDALGLEAKVLSNANLYRQLSTGIWVDDSSDNSFLVNQINSVGQPVRVTGVLRLQSGSSLGSGIAYTGDLTKQLIQQAEDTAIVKQQKANPNVSVFTGQPFEDNSSSQSGNSSTSKVSFTGTTSADATANASDTADSQTAQPQIASAVYQPQTQARTYQAADPSEMATVRFLDYNNNPIKTVQVQVGKKIPKADIPADQKRDSDNNYDYYFIGWRNLDTGEVCVSKDQFPVVEEDVDYIAFFYADSSHRFDPSKMTIAEMAAMLHMTEDELWQYVAEHVGLKQIEELLQMDDAQLLDRILDGITPEELAKALGVDPSIFHGIDLRELTPQELSNMVGMSISEILEKIFDAFDLGVFLGMLGTDWDDMDFSLDWLSDLLDFDISGIIASLGSAFSPDSIRTMLAQFSLGNPQDFASAMNKLGIQDLNSPSSISIYSPTYKDRTGVTSFISNYNAKQTNEDATVGYTDSFASLYNLMDVVGKVIGAIVAVALVVALFMFAMMVVRTALGSLIKRKQEIGILRALGASRVAVLKLFNAGSILEGLIAGIFGILLAFLISLAVNGALEKAMGLRDFMNLDFGVAMTMLLVSVGITFIAGFIPSFMAAKKDLEESL